MPSIKLKYGKILICLVLFLSVIACIPVTHLRIITPTYSCWLDQDQFSLRWRHSVEHQFWQEHYRRIDKVLLLDRTYLQTFGAGTPSQGKFIDSPKGYIGYQTQIKLKQLNWIVSHNMQGILMTKKGIIPLYQQLPDYSQVQILAKTTILSRYLIDQCL